MKSIANLVDAENGYGNLAANQPVAKPSDRPVSAGQQMSIRSSIHVSLRRVRLAERHLEPPEIGLDEGLFGTIATSGWGNPLMAEFAMLRVDIQSPSRFAASSNRATLAGAEGA